MGEEEEIPEVPVPEEVEPETEAVETEPEYITRHFRELNNRIDTLAEAHLKHLESHTSVPELEGEVEARPIEVVSVDVTPEKKEEEKRGEPKRKRRF